MLTDTVYFLCQWFWSSQHLMLIEMFWFFLPVDGADWMWSQRINDLLPMKSPWPCFRGLVGNNQNLATTPLAGNRRLTSRTRRRAASKMSLSSCQRCVWGEGGVACVLFLARSLLWLLQLGLFMCHTQITLPVCTLIRQKADHLKLKLKVESTKSLCIHHYRHCAIGLHYYCITAESLIKGHHEKCRMWMVFGERFFISVTIELMFHGAFHSNKVMPNGGIQTFIL